MNEDFLDLLGSSRHSARLADSIWIGALTLQHTHEGCVAEAPHGEPAAAAPIRIGILSDTHINKRGELWPQVFAAFAGVDAILHAGDVFSPHLLDELAAIAPVTVARGNGDFGVDDERLRETCVLEFGGVTVAMLHDFPSPARRGRSFVQAQAEKRFPGADVLICGHTHIAELHSLNGLLWVNPGSPTLPENKSRRLGTIGFLDIVDGAASAQLCQLTVAGHTSLNVPAA